MIHNCIQRSLARNGRSRRGQILSKFRTGAGTEDIGTNRNAHAHQDAHQVFCYTCNGARDNIFDHFLSRSSAPTTLVNRVPMGSPFLLIRTQALSSNLTRLPSFRCCSFLALTTTACLISPLRTLFVIPTLDPPRFSAPNVRCFWTTTIIRSPVSNVSESMNCIDDNVLDRPMLAAALFFLITATHSTMAAPELSMQLSIV